MEGAKTNRTTAKTQFTRAENSLQKALDTPDIPISTIERRFTELGARWERIQEAYDAYAVHAAQMTDDEAQKLDEWIDEITARYEEIEIRTDKYTESRTPKVVKQEQTATKNEQVSAVKIEIMKFTPFNGDIRRYPQFRE